MDNDWMPDGSVFVIEDLKAFRASLESDDCDFFMRGDHVFSYTSPKGFQYFGRLDLHEDGGVTFVVGALEHRLLADRDAPDGLKHIYDLPEDVVVGYKTGKEAHYEPFNFD